MKKDTLTAGGTGQYFHHLSFEEVLQQTAGRYQTDDTALCAVHAKEIDQ
jgi:hypothetical protein